ncbi:MAG: tRNA (adenosine(37)-N6)-threonylcarbamoyltransferase complex dimerization subunit type 1 TsaB [Alphaproteobacteria bacterium]|nr:tRNA (adenosine(37)-N6)-threonylcarbamoyltransferase complex dimerization subunit type 1 TsaB [Alphaproteobacteria bacterium]
MKNIIAITACLKRCSIAISYDGKILQKNEDVDAAANLAFLTRRLFEENEIDVRGIEGVITASGPGSFTGIRTAQSFAKAIAFSLEAPSASVSYFEVADRLKGNRNQNRLIALKADKNQVYFKKICKENCKGDIDKYVGISSYENIQKIADINSEIMLIGDAIDEVLSHIADYVIDFQKIEDIKNAANLLNLEDRITETSVIQPLYINLM